MNICIYLSFNIPFIQEVRIYKRYSDKTTEGMYFMIKFEKTFGKYVTICGKVGNIIKEI